MEMRTQSFENSQQTHLEQNLVQTWEMMSKCIDDIRWFNVTWNIYNDRGSECEGERVAGNEQEDSNHLVNILLWI